MLLDSHNAIVAQMPHVETVSYSYTRSWELRTSKTVRSTLLFQDTIGAMLAPGSLVIHGLVKLNNGADALTPIPRVLDTSTYLEFVPAERSNSPPPVIEPHPRSSSEIHLLLGDMLSQGDYHSVFSVSSSTGVLYSRMVIKISAEGEGRRLANEAAMYDYLRPLQGIVIPKCYGYFRTFVDLIDNVVTSWSSTDLSFPRSKDSLDIFRMPNANASLNILLLEHVGTRVNKHRLNIDEFR